MTADSEEILQWLARLSVRGDVIEKERAYKLVRSTLFGELLEATRIDRFVVLGRLGAGGMGVVYEAFDPHLERKIAIKLVGTSRASARGVHRERMLREARALAKLSHPHVVPVYEVGLHDDDVFIAMELVRGKTLREYAATRDRSWRELLHVYIQAGEGLAAAHDVGLVHRDFKPDNAIIGDDGRVRVVDFGLARVDGSIGATISASDQARHTPDESSNMLAGTPAYMAPEQRRGAPASAASDQFSFCAALYDALTGKPPEVDLTRDQTTGLASELGTGIPRRVRRAIGRGLSLRAEERFSTMHELLHELRAARSRSRGVRLGMGVAALVGTTVGASMAIAIAAADPCPDPTRELAAVWDDSRRAELVAAASGLPNTGEEIARVVARELDRHAEAWIAQRQATCEALHVRRTESEAMFDRRMQCLDRRRDAMGGLVELLVGAGAADWQHAVDSVLALSSAETCADREASSSDVALPANPELVEEIARIRRSIDHVDALRNLARLVEARELAEATVREALAVEHRPTQAEALHALGMLHAAEDRPTETDATLEDALWRAEAAGLDWLAASMVIKLARAAADRERLEEAEARLRRAQGLLERLDHPTALEIMFLRTRASIRAYAGQFDDALSDNGAALTLSQRHEGERSSSVAQILNDLGVVTYQTGDYATARDHFAAAIDIKHEWLGESHPDVLQTRLNLAGALERLGEEEPARQILEAVVADSERVMTGASSLLANALNNLAKLHESAGRTRDALPLAERAVVVMSESDGVDSPRVLVPLTTLGVVQTSAGQLDAVRETYARATAIADAIDPEHPLKCVIWNNLAELDIEDGKPEQARDHASKAVELFVRSHGPDHPVTGHLLTTFALAELELGATTEAMELAKEAIRVLAPSPARDDTHALARARFVLARALLHTDASEAIASASEALTAAAGTEDAELTNKIRSWLAERTE